MVKTTTVQKPNSELTRLIITGILGRIAFDALMYVWYSIRINNVE